MQGSTNQISKTVGINAQIAKKYSFGEKLVM